MSKNVSSCLRFTRQVWQSFVTTGGHDARCFPNLVVEEATPGIVKASLKIEPYHVNRVGTDGVCLVHGGLVLSLTDTLGSLAVASKGKYMTGVSTDIGTTFVKPSGRVGDTLWMTATVTGMGKSLAYTRVDFTKSLQPNSALLAYGYHTKYIAKSDSDKDVNFDESGAII
ncbi:hypothetical protein DL96DRAFT_173415 [Flagelloscypha sp. PMI_526]|nr:hypothetical protein DL96DRAFT_173415 [Flagelloscypha sp. PMI_526]